MPSAKEVLGEVGGAQKAQQGVPTGFRVVQPASTQETDNAPTPFDKGMITLGKIGQELIFPAMNQPPELVDAQGQPLPDSQQTRNPVTPMSVLRAYGTGLLATQPRPKEVPADVRMPGGRETIPVGPGAPQGLELAGEKYGNIARDIGVITVAAPAATFAAGGNPLAGITGGFAASGAVTGALQAAQTPEGILSAKGAATIGGQAAASGTMGAMFGTFGGPVLRSNLKPGAKLAATVAADTGSALMLPTMLSPGMAHMPDVGELADMMAMSVGFRMLSPVPEVRRKQVNDIPDQQFVEAIPEGVRSLIQGLEPAQQAEYLAALRESMFTAYERQMAREIPGEVPNAGGQVDRPFHSGERQPRLALPAPEGFTVRDPVGTDYNPLRDYNGAPEAPPFEGGPGLQPIRLTEPEFRARTNRDPADFPDLAVVPDNMPIPAIARAPENRQMFESVEAAAQEFGVPSPILHTVGLLESGYDPNTRPSSKGAKGAFQFLDDTASDMMKALGLDPKEYNPRDFRLQSRLAAKYLRDQYAEFGNWKDALAAYNWGPGHLREALEKNPTNPKLPKETIKYLKDIQEGVGWEMLARAEGLPEPVVQEGVLRQSAEEVVAAAEQVAAIDAGRVGEVLGVGGKTEFKPQRRSAEGGGSVLLSENTIPGEGKYRVTYLRDDGTPMWHTDYPTARAATAAFKDVEKDFLSQDAPPEKLRNRRPTDVSRPVSDVQPELAPETTAAPELPSTQEATTEGTVRLYRGETKTGQTKDIPLWVTEDPAFQQTKAATGRWFTSDLEEARWYAKEGQGDIFYVDVPASQLDAFRASNQEAGKFSAAGKAESEFFLPEELARKATRSEPVGAVEQQGIAPRERSNSAQSMEKGIDALDFSRMEGDTILQAGAKRAQEALSAPINSLDRVLEGFEQRRKDAFKEKVNNLSFRTLRMLESEREYALKKLATASDRNYDEAKAYVEAVNQAIQRKQQERNAQTAQDAQADPLASVLSQVRQNRDAYQAQQAAEKQAAIEALRPPKPVEVPPSLEEIVAARLENPTSPDGRFEVRVSSVNGRRQFTVVDTDTNARVKRAGNPLVFNSMRAAVRDPLITGEQVVPRRTPQRTITEDEIANNTAKPAADEALLTRSAESPTASTQPVIEALSKTRPRASSIREAQRLDDPLVLGEHKPEAAPRDASELVVPEEIVSRMDVPSWLRGHEDLMQAYRRGDLHPDRVASEAAARDFDDPGQRFLGEMNYRTELSLNPDNFAAFAARELYNAKQEAKPPRRGPRLAMLPDDFLAMIDTLQAEIRRAATPEAKAAIQKKLQEVIAEAKRRAAEGVKVVPPPYQGKQQDPVEAYPIPKNFYSAQDFIEAQLSGKPIDAVRRDRATKGDINPASHWFILPEYLHNYPAARQAAVDIIESSQLVDHMARQMKAQTDLIRKELYPGRLKGVKQAVAGVRGRRAEKEMTALLRKLEKDPNAFDDAPPLIAAGASRLRAYFDKVREDVRTWKRIAYRDLLEGDRVYAFEQVIDNGATIEAAVEAVVQGRLESIRARKGDVAAEKAAARVKKRVTKEITEMVESYREVDGWGLEDFATKLEQGHLYLRDEHGTIRAVASGPWDAGRKAARLKQQDPTMYIELDASMPLFDAPARMSKKRYQQALRKLEKNLEKAARTVNEEMLAEMREQGIEDLQKEFGKSLYVSPKKVRAKFAGPLEQRKFVLEGEENIFDVMDSYTYSVYKKLVMDPLIARTNRVLRDPDLPPNSRHALKTQLESAKGRYWYADRVVDDFLQKLATKTSTATGGRVELYPKPFAYSRYTGKARGAVAHAALGYRVAAGVVNRLTNERNLFSKFGAKYRVDASKFLRTEAGKQLILEEEPYLGMSFVEEATGRLHTREPWWHPLKMFNWAEPGNRKMSYAAGYLYAKQELGITNEAAARSFARSAVRTTSFVYSIAAMPEVLRGPTGRTVGLFKSFIVQDLHRMMSLNKNQLWREVVGSVAIGGPRMLMATIKAMPFLGPLLVGGADDWLRERFPVLSRGVAGLLGADITHMMAVNPIDRAEDAYGIVIAHALAIQDALAPLASGTDYAPVAGERLRQLPGQFSPQAANMMKLWDQFVTGDGWVRDRQGNPIYHSDSAYNATLTVMGFKPLEESQIQETRYSISEQERRDRELQTAVSNKAAREIRQDGTISEGTLDLISRHMISADSIIASVTRQMTPPEIAILRRTLTKNQPEVVQRLETVLRGLE